MKTRNKALLTAMCAVLLVVCSVLGTMAYLTSTDTVTNTFTVGKVEITLNEADVKTDGAYETDVNNRVQENEYHLLPGRTYIKDPTVHVKADSEPCYVFVKIQNDIKNIEIADSSSENETIAEQMETLGWNRLTDENGQAVGTEIYYYAGSLAPDSVVSPGADLVVFNDFTIDGDKVIGGKEPAEGAEEGKEYLGDYATAEGASTNLITVTAYAIQKEGFASPLEAWTASGFSNSFGR